MHITPTMMQLHWLPVPQCVEFMLAVLVYKALNGPSPQYWADDCQLTTFTSRRRLLLSNVASSCNLPHGDVCGCKNCTNRSSCLFTVSGTYHLRVMLAAEDTAELLRTIVPSDCSF